jgi:hypothetical protein
MSQIVQARCPQCKQVLRVPAQWLTQPMRCKHCKQVFQAKAKGQSQPTAGRVAGAIVSGKPAGTPASPFSIPHSPPDGADFQFTMQGGPRRPYRRRAGPGRWLSVLVGLLLVASLTVAGMVFSPQLADFVDSIVELPQDGAKSPVAAVSPVKGPTAPAEPDNSGNGTGTPVVPKNNGGITEPVTPKPENPTPGPKDPPKVTPEPKDPPKVTPPVTPPDEGTKPKPQPPPKKTVYPQEKYPRRALAISVNDYLLANSLGYGLAKAGTHPGSNAREVLNALGNFYTKFPNTQLFELSDAAKGSEVPLAPVIKNAIAQFLNTSRPQDHIVVFFAGHVASTETDVFLVPIEGDLDDPKTLIPLAWVYEQMQKCPARQKVLILDVCRFNPSRGYERPGGEEMGEITEKKLKETPAGVQALVACSEKQQSIELDKGSLFQEALCAVLNEKPSSIPYADEPLPLEDLVPRVNDYLKKRLPMDLKQTCQLYGKMPATGAAFDPEQAPAAKFNMAALAPSGGYAGKAEVMSILKELTSIPPVRAGKKAGKDELRFEVLPPFSAKVLAEYQIDGYSDEMDFLNQTKEFPIRAAVVKTKKTMKKVADDFKLKEYFNGTTNAQVKTAVKAEQSEPAKALYVLKESLAELVDAEKVMDQEPSKRWRAHYLYTLAHLKIRLIYVLEYNRALAEIRMDVLELPKGATGFQLASTEKPTAKVDEMREWTKQLKKHWKQIIEDYPDTPWALLARREKDASLGLEWKAIQN